MNDRERRKASHSHQLNVERSNTSVGKLLEIIIELSRRQRDHEKKLAKCKSHFVTLISYFISFSSGHHTHYWFMSCPNIALPINLFFFFSGFISGIFQSTWKYLGSSWIPLPWIIDEFFHLSHAQSFLSFVTRHIDMLLENILFTEIINFLIYNVMLSIHRNILTWMHWPYTIEEGVN